VSSRTRLLPSRAPVRCCPARCFRDRRGLLLLSSPRGGKSGQESKIPTLRPGPSVPWPACFPSIHGGRGRVGPSEHVFDAGPRLSEIRGPALATCKEGRGPRAPPLPLHGRGHARSLAMRTTTATSTPSTRQPATTTRYHGITTIVSRQKKSMGILARREGYSFSPLSSRARSLPGRRRSATGATVAPAGHCAPSRSEPEGTAVPAHPVTSCCREEKVPA
jgi:hypothetical protein